MAPTPLGRVRFMGRTGSNPETVDTLPVSNLRSWVGRVGQAGLLQVFRSGNVGRLFRETGVCVLLCMCVCV